METAPDEAPTEFLEPGEEIVENVIEEEVVHEEDVEHHEEDGEMIEVQHEEVLEEIVEEDGMMFDTDGRVIEYSDVMVYEEGTEVIEEYVEVEDLGDGRYAYVMTDDIGHRRLLKPHEVEAVKKMPGMMEEEVVMDDEKAPNTSYAAAQKRGRFPPQARSSLSPQKPRAAGAYMGPEAYYQQPKRMTHMAKVDVEKYSPVTPVNRRPLMDNAIFKSKLPRKSAPWQEETAANGGPQSTSLIRSPSPMLKEPLFDDNEIRFKCAECGDGFPVMDRLCDHMIKQHDCQTNVREVQFFADRDFENFLLKVEKATLGRDPEDAIRKKSRAGSSQLFVCNYMNKGRQKMAELVEVGIVGLSERPLEVCTAFVQKTHGYECIRVKYCDQHIHYDGNIGFRVPIAVKRRLFEMSFKRLPIPCMQIMLGLEAEQLLPHPTRFEEKLKNLSHVEIIELLQIINASLRKHQEVEPRGKKVPIKFETIKSSEGSQTLMVKRVTPPKKEHMDYDEPDPNIPSTSAQALGYNPDDDEGDDVPMMSREEEVLDDETGEESVMTEDCDGMMEDNMLYDPENNRDPLFDELTEVELGVLDAYEHDIEIALTEAQKKERTRLKAKFALNKVIGIYQTLDTATHGLTAGELHTDTINHLRDMASYVVELVCQIDAEVKVRRNPALRIDDVKRDMIAGIAMQERVHQPERRPRRSAAPASPAKPQYRPQPPARSHEEYTQRIMNKVKEYMPRRRPDAYDLQQGQQQSRLQMLREQTLLRAPLEEEKPPVATMAPVPDEHKAIPWTRPGRKRAMGPGEAATAPAKRRGRPTKKEEAAEAAAKLIQAENEMVVEEEEVEEPPVVEQEQVPKEKEVEVAEAEKLPEQVKTEPSVTPSSAPPTPATTATKTRTGRVVKPKKWDDN